MTTICSSIVSPELPYIQEFTEDDCQQILKYTFSVIASRFIQSSYLKISILNAQPADRDKVCLPFWTHPPWILLLSLRTTDELSTVARPWTCPSSLTFSSLCLSWCVHVCAQYTLRVCKSSSWSTIVTYVNPRSFASFFTYPSSSWALYAFAASSHLPRPWHLPSTFSCLP